MRSKFLAAPLLCPLPREPTLYSMPTLNSGPCSGITFSERHPLLTFSFLVYFLAHRAVYSKYYAKCLLLTWLLRYCSSPCPSALEHRQNSLFIVPSTLELFIFIVHMCHFNHNCITVSEYFSPLRVKKDYLECLLLYFTSFESHPPLPPPQLLWQKSAKIFPALILAEDKIE